MGFIPSKWSDFPLDAPTFSCFFFFNQLIHHFWLWGAAPQASWWTCRKPVVEKKYLLHNPLVIPWNTKILYLALYLVLVYDLISSINWCDFNQLSFPWNPMNNLPISFTGCPGGGRHCALSQPSRPGSHISLSISIFFWWWLMMVLSHKWWLNGNDIYIYTYIYILITMDHRSSLSNGDSWWLMMID
jgi:hypothetical protein